MPPFGPLKRHCLYMLRFLFRPATRSKCLGKQKYFKRAFKLKHQYTHYTYYQLIFCRRAQPKLVVECGPVFFPWKQLEMTVKMKTKTSEELMKHCRMRLCETKLLLKLNNFTPKLDFDVLSFRKRAYKILEEKKRKTIKTKKLIAAKNGLVGIKGHVKGYNHVKYFLPYLSCLWIRPFLSQTFKRFSGPKTEVMWPIALKFGTSI